MRRRGNSKTVRRRRRQILVAALWIAVTLILFAGLGAWLNSKATVIKSELQSATKLLSPLKAQIAANDATAAGQTVDALVEHTSLAREAANDPVWRAASILPWVGPNLQAASEVATSADDVARLGAMPLVKAFQSLDWKSLTPTQTGSDLEPLRKAAPQVQAAAHAVRETSNRLNNINVEGLLPQIAEPLVSARSELKGLSAGLNSAADAARLAPGMLGADSPRRYLLLMQNNAESRASGGIPGALAVLTVTKGKIDLEAQTSASALGSFVPPVTISPEEQAIYSGRVGKFMQDVNLTPDFETTASTAQAMWEKNSGEQLSGVLSLDPVALSFILEATGPVEITDPVVQRIGSELPAQLNSSNVVQTLLSDAYAKIEEPKLQDIYFAGAAQEIFAGVSSGNTDPKKLMDAISRGVDDRRILLWSAETEEQAVIGKYPIAGLISGPSVSPTQFGVYFNDGTGAKMDYWVKRKVQIVKDCTRDGYREVAVRVVSTNTAPSNAGSTLSPYVTGAGAYGVPAGFVQTNIVAYGPAQSNVDTVVKDGVKIPFAAQRHSQRPVGTSTIRLAPGQSTTLDFTFGHIVQHAEPDVAVTPTTQPVNEVVQAPTTTPCE